MRSVGDDDPYIARGIGIVITSGWILFSAMNYDRAVEPEGNPWLRGVVILGLLVGLPLFARLFMAEGRARERRQQAERARREESREPPSAKS